MDASPTRLSRDSEIEALRRLCGLLAHDLNNQLGVISNNLHLVQRLSAASASTAAPIAATLKALMLASVLTGHLQRLSRRPERRARTLALGDVIDQTTPLLASVIGRRAELRVSVEAPALSIVADPDDFELALLNLAFNARQAFKDCGCVRLRVRAAAAGEAPASVPGPCVAITFGDDGRGLDEEALAHAFEPGFTTHGADSSGLGLSQVLAFCEHAGGTATLASTPGFGTTASLWLPARP